MKGSESSCIKAASSTADYCPLVEEMECAAGLSLAYYIKIDLKLY